MEDAAHQLGRSMDTVSKYLGMYVEAHRITEISAWVPPAMENESTKPSDSLALSV
jgi:hypothetical protein